MMARAPRDSRKRVLAVGYGLMGSSLARLIDGSGWAKIIGAVDASDTALQQATENHQLHAGATGTHLRTVLQRLQPDIVSINTPSEYHFKQVMTALDTGCHVLVAKPVASGLNEALRIAKHAQLCRRKVVVGQQMRFNRHYRSVAAFVASGAIGKVESVQLMNSKPRHQALNLGTMPEPAMLEMACHHFDALLSFLPRARPQSIVAQGFRPSWSVYDGHCMVNAIIELSSGVNVLYHGGFSSQAEQYELRLEGTRGALRCRGSHMSGTAFAYEVAERGGAFVTADLESAVEAGSPWQMYLAQWQRYLQGGAEPVFSVRRNLPVFALLSAGIESIRRGKRIDLTSSARYAAALAR